MGQRLSAEEFFDGIGMHEFIARLPGKGKPELWALLDVGCLHCTAPPRVVSLYASEEEAEAAQERFEEEMEAREDQSMPTTTGCWFDDENGFMHAAFVVKLEPGCAGW